MEIVATPLAFSKNLAHINPASLRRQYLASPVRSMNAGLTLISERYDFSLDGEVHCCDMNPLRVHRGWGWARNSWNGNDFSLSLPRVTGTGRGCGSHFMVRAIEGSVNARVHGAGCSSALSACDARLSLTHPTLVYLPSQSLTCPRPIRYACSCAPVARRCPVARGSK